LARSPGAAAWGRSGLGYAFAAGTAFVLALSATPAAAQDGTGGATATPPPSPKTATMRSKVRLTRLACVNGCGAGGSVRPGALLRVRAAKGLRRATEVDFAGAPGDGDDVAAAPVVRRRSSVDVRVPLTAASGPVSVIDRYGLPTAPAPAALVVVPAPAPAGAPSIDVDVQAPKAFFDARKPMRVAYVVHDAQPVEVQVDLVRERDGAVVAHWSPGVVQPETTQSVQWNGLAGGKVQRPGKYSFRVTSADTAGAVRATSSQVPEPAPGDPSVFTFLRHQFPIRGPHTFGTGVAAFGGGRGHQGEDVFAACGTPLVAARGGTVKFKAYQSRAGNYLVVDGEKTGIDYTYMHMKAPALVGKGDRVRTGQLIGYVGDTGDARGCHLHFEMWSAPGWYTGGSPFDPLPSLRDWDRSS
jgi:murein DD-endopeptidase MepM/ murein hydrolase activator NlpD